MRFASDTLAAALAILNGASVWLVMAFALAGLMHVLVRPDRLQRALGNRRVATLFKAALSGMLLPLCSCGVIPIGLSLYYSGAYLGPTLTFMTAAPVINPAAVILAYALLGPKIATIYWIGGFGISIFVGLVGNRLGGSELRFAEAPEEQGEVSALAPVAREPWPRRLLAGQRWGFTELGTMVSRYVLLGMLLGGAIIAAVPATFIQDYLGRAGALSLGAAAVLGAVMYVCAVGHIPFIAALVAAGAAPGLAITFLMTGTATNAPELLSIWKLMGRRSALIYSGSLIAGAFVVGGIANTVLGPGFVPVFDTSGATGAVDIVSRMTLSGLPVWAQYACTAVVLGLGLHSWASSAQILLVRVRRAEA